MDIFDPTMAVPVDSAPQQDAKGKGKGAAADADDGTAAATNAEPQQEQSLEQEVQQLVAGVSSWWSGFSQKSQQQIEAARAHIQEQGGLVALAKKEAQRFEASMTEAQKQAREKALQLAPLTEEEKARIAASGAKGKAKGGEAAEDEEEDKELEETVKGKGKARAAEPKVRSTTSGDATSGEELFDAEKEDGGAPSTQRSSQDYTRAAALSTGAALGSAQAWFSKVQSSIRADPTLASMQKSLADTVASFNAGDKAKGGAGEKEKDDAQTADEKREAVLPHLAGTIKAALPHLSWDKSQEMARRYYNDAGSVVRELGKEVKVLAEDLVKIVPGEEKEKLAVPGDAKGKETDDDLGSDWDVDVESEAPSSATAAAAGGGAGAGTVTAQPKATAAPSLTSGDKPAPKVEAKTERVKAEEGKKKDEEDEDSDWE